ncbi:MAG: flagellar hook-length control protein FliK [Steroidobacteraceae bacterium]
MGMQGLGRGSEVMHGNVVAAHNKAGVVGGSAAADGVFSAVFGGMVNADDEPSINNAAPGDLGEEMLASMGAADDTDDSESVQPDVAAEMLAMLGNAPIPARQVSLPTITATPDKGLAASDVSTTATSELTGSAGIEAMTVTVATVPDKNIFINNADIATAGKLASALVSSTSNKKSDFSALLASDVGEVEAVVPKDAVSEVVTPEAVKALVADASPVIAMLNAKIDADTWQGHTAKHSDEYAALNFLDTTALQAPDSRLSNDVASLQQLPRYELQSHVGSQHWATELGNKLMLLAGKESQSATLYLTPADLGPVQVRIDTDKGQDKVSVWFTAEHVDTRTALEQSLPRLRELFAAQGMSLTDAGVFGRRSGQQPASSGSKSNWSEAGVDFMGDDGRNNMVTALNVRLGMLDAYA